MLKLTWVVTKKKKMRTIKYQAIIFSIIYGLLPIIMMILRFLGLDKNGELLSFEFYFILGILTMIIIAFPIGIYVQKKLEEEECEKEEDNLLRLLNKFFLCAVILNLISIPLLGINTVLSIIPSMVFASLTILLSFSKKKSKTFNSTILDDETN